MLPGFTRIIGILRTLALSQQAPRTFGRLEGTQTTVGLSGQSFSLIHPGYEQNPQSARRNNSPGGQISRRLLRLSENLSASNYPGAAYDCLARGVSTK